MDSVLKRIELRMASQKVRKQATVRRLDGGEKMKNVRKNSSVYTMGSNDLKGASKFPNFLTTLYR